jgi:hypothetical protein
VGRIKNIDAHDKRVLAITGSRYLKRANELAGIVEKGVCSLCRRT